MSPALLARLGSCHADLQAHSLFGPELAATVADPCLERRAFANAGLAKDLSANRRALPVLPEEIGGGIYDYLPQHNAKPKPFTWTKTADDILTRERRALNALDEIRGSR